MPATKRQIEPDIEPSWPGYGVIDGENKGDGSSTPERDSIHALNDLETNPEEAPSPDESVADQEEAGGPEVVEKGDWTDKTEPREYKDSEGKTPKGMNVRRKKGPLALILGGTAGGAGIAGLLFSPAMMFIQMKEALIGKGNMQLASMHVRTHAKIRAKIKNTTGGVCVGIKIMCKYKSMSAKQIAAFDKAGIKIKGNESFFPGRIRPTDFEFNGKPISADDFSKMMRTDPKFRAAVNNGYNPKFAGYADSIWQKTAKWLGIKKSKVKLNGDTPEEKMADLEATAKGTSSADGSKILTRTGEDGKIYLVDKDGNFLEDVDGNKIEANVTDVNADEFTDFDNALRQTDEIVESGDKAMKEIAEEIAGGSGVKRVITKGANILKVTGYFDDACTVYNTVRAVGFAAKTVRFFQLVDYAMVFLRLADQMKAGGNPDPKDVEVMGDILTKEISGAGKVLVRSATESFGYKYAAFGERGKMPGLSMQFLAGGGLTGDIIHITDYFKVAFAGGNPKKICHTLANPIVSVASIVAGALLLYFTAGSGTTIIQALKAAGTTAAKSLGTWVSIGMVAANLVLPALLKNIIAGNVIDGSTVGEKAMEAITSGSFGIMSKTAAAGANAPLKSAEAAEYSELGMQIQEQYAEEDRLAYSPFDITNSNTFMGKLFSKLTPYIVNMNSVANILSSISSITTNSMSLAINSQTASADTADEYKNWCGQDEDYKDMDLATDPYCNVIYGIPPAYLEKDPIEVLNDLQGEIDPDTGAPSSENYKKFVEKCIDRKEPLGNYGSTSGITDGSECLFGAKFDTTENNSNYYLHLIDQRVEAGMSGEDEVLNAATNYGYISFYDPVDDVNADDVATTDLVKDLTVINENEQKVTEAVVSDALDKPEITINQCQVNESNDQIIGLDVLCGYPYFGPVKNKGYEI